MKNSISLSLAVILTSFVSSVASAGQANWLVCNSKHVSVTVSDMDSISLAVDGVRGELDDSGYFKIKWAATKLSVRNRGLVIRLSQLPRGVVGKVGFGGDCKNIERRFNAIFSGSLAGNSVPAETVACTWTHTVSAGSACD